MKSAADYLGHIKALIALNRQVVHSHPHHVHDGAEANVLPHGLIDAEDVLTVIAVEADD